MGKFETAEEALMLPNGARYYRCALQVNPPHYLGTYRGQKPPADEQVYVTRLLDKCVELNVEVIAVTDHNHVGAVELFQGEAEARGITVFPGFELTSKEGVHILCLYPSGTGLETLGRYLGQFGIVDTDPSTKLSDKTVSQILEDNRRQGGVAVAAHVTQKAGLLTVLKGRARANAWRDPNLLAVQVPGPVDQAPSDKRRILENHDADHAREHPVGDNLAVAVINAKDVAEPADLEDPSASCWIKMSTVSVEGLRQAFLDPRSRIRLASDPIPEKHAEILSVAWLSGFLDDAAIHFNENLNVLIGGRGAGKSTVVESLRYVLALQPLGDDASKAHEGIVQNVLCSGTKISLLVQSHRPSPKKYLIERTVPNPPIVRDESGRILNIEPAQLIPGLEVYGQHEISELTKSEATLPRLLIRFVKPDETLASKKIELRRALEKSRNRILELRKETQLIEDRLHSLPVLEENLKRFQEAGLEQRLREQSLLVREERVLQTASERTRPFEEVLDQLSEALPIDRAFLSASGIHELPGKGFLEQADKVLKQLDKNMSASRDSMSEHVAQARRDLEDVRKRWSQRKANAQAQYEEVLRQLQKSKVDGDEFIRLRRAIEELRPLKERLSAIQRDMSRLQDERRDLLAEWEDLQQEDFRQLERAGKKVNRELRDAVRVTVTFAGNREPLMDILDEMGGRFAETKRAICEKADFSLREFAEACSRPSEVLMTEFGATPGQAQRLSQADASTRMRIEEVELPPTMRIELNVAAEGKTPEWQELKALSTGQKATAVLLILLLESPAPLIVDQPEDDLDNRFITDYVVPKMREEKCKRQFLFATHNANIPVLGDAELIIGLTARGEAGEGRAKLPLDHMGSIDAPMVRDLVEEVLEGGKDAFETRRLKYGF